MEPDSMARFRYQLTVQTEQPDVTSEEAVRQLRGALKSLLRQWDLRCTSVAPIETPAAPDDEPPTGQPNANNSGASQ